MYFDLSEAEGGLNMIQDIRQALYKQGLSDGEIARETNATTNAIRKWRNRRKLPPNVNSYYQPRGNTGSLCNTCRHAYGGDCFATPIEARTWVKSYKTKTLTPVTAPEYQINYVHACERYRAQGARVRLSVDQPERIAALQALQGIRGSAIT